MSRFFKTSWYRGGKAKSNKSAFGGTIASQEEVTALSKKIETKEAKEFEKFEADFDNQLKNL